MLGLVAAVALVGVLASSHGRHHRPRITSTTPSSATGLPGQSPAQSQPSTPRVTTTVAVAPTTTTTVAPDARSYGIGETTQVFTEPGKLLEPPHSPAGSQPAPRQVSAQILYPTSANLGGPLVAGAAPSRAGPFPLVVFGPGFDITTSVYLPVLEGWASRGFVVAAITFPLTNPYAPGGPYRGDLVNQPADMATVAQGLIADGSNPNSVLHGVVNGAELALAGQSDGGDTALALAYNTCCRTNLAVAATVILSGAEPHAVPFSGTYFPPGAGAPLLGFQGTADRTNPPSYTDQYFASAPQPKYLVCLLGAHHLPAYTQINAWEQVVVGVSVDFLDAELWHRPGALAAMSSALAASSGVAQLATSCPYVPAG